jgi:hypothetical protein
MTLLHSLSISITIIMANFMTVLQGLLTGLTIIRVNLC